MSQFTRLYATAKYCDSLGPQKCAATAACIVDAASGRCHPAHHAQPLDLSPEGVDQLRHLIDAYERARAQVMDAVAEKEAEEKRVAALECELKKAGHAYKECTGTTLPPPDAQPTQVTPNLDTVLSALYNDLGVARAIPTDRPLIPDDVLDAVDAIRADATQYLKEKGTTFLSGFDKPSWLKTRQERGESTPAKPILDALQAMNRYVMIKEFNPTDDLIAFLTAIVVHDGASIIGYKHYDVPFQAQTVRVPCFAFTPVRQVYDRAVLGALNQIAKVSWPNDLLTLNERENKRRLQPTYDRIRHYFNEEGGRFNKVRSIRTDILNDLIQYIMPVVQPVANMSFVVMPFSTPPPSLTCAQIQDFLSGDGADIVRSVCATKPGCESSMTGTCQERSAAVTPEPETPPPPRPARPAGFLSGITARRIEGGVTPLTSVKPFTLMVKSADTGSDPVPLTILKMETVNDFARKFTSAQFCGVQVGSLGTSGVVNLYTNLRPLTLINFLHVARDESSTDFGNVAYFLLRDNVYSMMGRSAANEADLSDAVKAEWYNQSVHYMEEAFGRGAPEIKAFQDAVNQVNLLPSPRVADLQTSFCGLDAQVQDYLVLRGVCNKEDGKVALLPDENAINVAKQVGLDPLLWYPPLTVPPVKQAYDTGGAKAAQDVYKKLTSADKTQYGDKLKNAVAGAKRLHTTKTVPFLTQWEEAVISFGRCTAPPYTRHLNPASPFCAADFTRLTKLSDGVQCVKAAAPKKLTVPSGFNPFARGPPPAALTS